MYQNRLSVTVRVTKARISSVGTINRVRGGPNIKAQMWTERLGGFLGKDVTS